MSKWNEKSLADYDNKVADLLASLRVADCSVHFGISNKKTKMVNEGTSAGLAGTCDESCVGDCREGCYAIVHGDGVYKSARRNHAENTILRRANPVRYYEQFFEFALVHGKSLRLNETGDFETQADIEAVYSVAQKYPSVRVIGYTKRANLLRFVSMLNKLENVMIHFSLACKGFGKAIAEMNGVPYTQITTEPTECTCPAQIAKMNGNSVNWSCSMCAEKGCGCFSSKNVTFLAH